MGHGLQAGPGGGVTVEGEGRGGEGIEGGVEVNGCDGSERMSVDEPVFKLGFETFKCLFPP